MVCVMAISSKLDSWQNENENAERKKVNKYKLAQGYQTTPNGSI